MFWFVVVLSIDILLHLIWVWIRCIQRKLFSCFDFGAHPLFDLRKCSVVRHALFNQPACKQFQRIAFGSPMLFLFPGSIVGTLDVADMVSMKAIGVAEYERGPFALSSA